MECTKKKRHTDAELIEIFRQKDIPEKYFQKFLDVYSKTFQEFNKEMEDYEDEDFNEGDSVQASALRILNLYMNFFLKNINIGHSDEWADLIAKHYDEDDQLFEDAYQEMKENNPEQAREELLIQCRFLKGDENFTRYFLLLFESNQGYTNPGKKAKDYSIFYNKQISLGKSATFAHEYADLMAWDEYVESYCDAYATAYDDSLQAGRSEDYARRYAEMYGDFVGDNFSKFSDALKHRDYRMEHEMIIGNMKGWEYACENNMDEQDLFVSIYEKTHMNTYFDDDGYLNNIESIDKIVLTVALEEYNRRVKK